jgi:hypothetical protein
MSELERDLPNGYFSYLENVELKTKSAKQVANNVVTINNYNLRSVIEVGGTVFGLGWEQSNGKIVVYYDLTGTPAYSQASTLYSSNGKAYPFFISDGTYIYYDNGNSIGKYTISSHAQNGDWITGVTGGLAGGIFWNKYLYGFQPQDVYVVDTTNATATKMVTVPPDQTIVQLVPYGQLLAIICTSSTNECYMFLWDGVNVTATPWTDIVKIGYGTLFGAELIDGVITAFVNFKNARGFRIKKYDGAKFITTNTYYGRKNLAGNKYVSGNSQIKHASGYLYFIALATTPNSANNYDNVIMRYGRDDDTQGYQLSVWKTLEISTNNSNQSNDLVIVESNSSIIPAVYASVLTDTNVTTSSHNVRTEVFTSQPAVIETGIFTGGDSSIEKQLKELSIKCDPLTSGQSATLKYKINAETSWTTIYVMNTVGDISYEPVNESNGDNLKTFKEIQFRIELLGGCKLVGFSFIYEEELGQT